MKIIIIIFILSFITAADSPLKRILMVGDSILIAYGGFLREYIAGKYEFRAKENLADAVIDPDNPHGANAGDSRMILNYLKHFDEIEIKHCDDIVLLNCGLHDIKTDKITRKRAVCPEEYRSNLDSIVILVNRLKKALIWINTTPVNDSIHNSGRTGFYRFNKDVEKYNSIADSLFRHHNIPVIDLYSFTKDFPLEAYSDHVHFKIGYAKLQARFISECLQSFL